jgi:hypothetical protein
VASIAPTAPLPNEIAAQAMSSVSMRRSGEVEVIAATRAIGPARAPNRSSVWIACEQHPAAVALFHAPACFIEVLGRSPPADRGGSGDERAELARSRQRGDLSRSVAEAMLKHHAETPPCPLHRVHARQRPLNRHLGRLLEQHVLAGGGRALDQLEMGVRGRQQEDNFDRGIREHLIETVDHRQGGVLTTEGIPPIGARRVTGRDLDPVGEVAKAQKMRLEGHPKSDHCDPSSLHGASSLPHIGAPCRRFNSGSLAGI